MNNTEKPTEPLPQATGSAFADAKQLLRCAIKVLERRGDETPLTEARETLRHANRLNIVEMELRCVWCDFPLTQTLKLKDHKSGYCRACRCRVRGRMKPRPGLPNAKVSGGCGKRAHDGTENL